MEGRAGRAALATRVPAISKLVYPTITSLDGYTADEHSNIDWDPEVFTFINELERGVGTYFCERRMYEPMVSWETFDVVEDQPAPSIHLEYRMSC